MIGISTLCPLVFLRAEITVGCVSSNALSLKNSSLSAAFFKSLGSPMVSDRAMGLKEKGCVLLIRGPFNSLKASFCKTLSVLIAVETLLISGPKRAFPLEGAKSVIASLLLFLKIPILP